jgi:arylsulfatase A-like enzyme
MPDRPNVLFVLCDQLRAEALSCAGDPNVETPNIDRLADEGALFERAYTPYPVCSPARASILTGMHGHEHEMISNTYLKLRLPTELTTVAESLGEVGYDTGYVGKWHLDGTDDVPGHVPPGPRRQGFEFWEGFNRGHQHLKGHPHFDDDGSVEWEDGYQPEIQADIAIDYIESERENPFFCFLSWGPPHTPFEAPDEYSAMYDADDLDLRPNVPQREAAEVRRDLVEYYGMVTSLDDQVGRLLDTLEREGVADDTLVVFTSDHGEMMGSNGEHHKGIPHEESVHVPLVVRYPDGVEPQETDTLASLIDLYPTLCDYADAPVPEEQVTGESLRPVLDGEEAGRDRLYIEGALPFDHTWRAVRTDSHMLAVDRHVETTHLYDTDADPYQQENLAGEAPDLEARLREALFEEMDDLDDRYMTARREMKELQS